MLSPTILWLAALVSSLSCSCNQFSLFPFNVCSICGKLFQSKCTDCTVGWPRKCTLCFMQDCAELKGTGRIARTWYENVLGKVAKLAMTTFACPSNCYLCLICISSYTYTSISPPFTPAYHRPHPSKHICNIVKNPPPFPQIFYSPVYMASGKCGVGG